MIRQEGGTFAILSVRSKDASGMIEGNMQGRGYAVATRGFNSPDDISIVFGKDRST
jgi:hypothetical protein